METETETKQKKAKSKPNRNFAAMAICAAYGISPDRFEYAVNKVSYEMKIAPKAKKQAAGHRTARAILAKQMGIPAVRIPVMHIYAKAISRYEMYRLHREQWDQDGKTNWVGNFDYQSRRFAIENQVCPRCGMAAEFSAQNGGTCECGYQY